MRGWLSALAALQALQEGRRDAQAWVPARQVLLGRSAYSLGLRVYQLPGEPSGQCDGGPRAEGGAKLRNLLVRNLGPT